MTVTVTCGDVKYFIKPSRIAVANCMEVSPAAVTSLSNGKEIFPSGRTGIVREMSGSFQTSMRTISCGPILYSASAGEFEAISSVFREAEIAFLSGDCAESSTAMQTIATSNAADTLIIHSSLLKFQSLMLRFALIYKEESYGQFVTPELRVFGSTAPSRLSRVLVAATRLLPHLLRS